MKNCPWYKRWWHRRLRKTDRQIMRASMVSAIERHNDPTPKETLDKMWKQFINEPGQERWHCPCSQNADSDLFT